MVGAHVTDAWTRPDDRQGPLYGITVFIAGLATAGAARGASAQPARESHRIGWLSPAAAATGAPNLDALRQGLRELGYEEGRNLALEERWANGISERLPALARELVQLRVDVICTAGTQATRAARDATATIPIVFANVAFPVHQQLVVSYAHPGGNVTGVAFIGPGDMGLSIGLGGAAGRQAMEANIQKVLDACKRRNVVPGIFAGASAGAGPGTSDVEQRVKQGFRFIAFGDDGLGTNASNVLRLGRMAAKR